MLSQVIGVEGTWRGGLVEGAVTVREEDGSVLHAAMHRGVINGMVKKLRNINTLDKKKNCTVYVLYTYIRLRLLTFFFKGSGFWYFFSSGFGSGSGSQGPKKNGSDYWLSLAKYSFPRKL